MFWFFFSNIATFAVIYDQLEPHKLRTVTVTYSKQVLCAQAVKEAVFI